VCLRHEQFRFQWYTYYFAFLLLNFCVLPACVATVTGHASSSTNWSEQGGAFRSKKGQTLHCVLGYLCRCTTLMAEILNYTAHWSFWTMKVLIFRISFNRIVLYVEWCRKSAGQKEGGVKRCVQLRLCGCDRFLNINMLCLYWVVIIGGSPYNMILQTFIVLIVRKHSYRIA
jgi:hypothetical protein